MAASSHEGDEELVPPGGAAGRARRPWPTNAKPRRDVAAPELPSHPVLALCPGTWWDGSTQPAMDAGSAATSLGEASGASAPSSPEHRVDAQPPSAPHTPTRRHLRPQEAACPPTHPYPHPHHADHPLRQEHASSSPPTPTATAAASFTRRVPHGGSSAATPQASPRRLQPAAPPHVDVHNSPPATQGQRRTSRRGSSSGGGGNRDSSPQPWWARRPTALWSSSSSSSSSSSPSARTSGTGADPRSAGSTRPPSPPGAPPEQVEAALGAAAKRLLGHADGGSSSSAPALTVRTGRRPVDGCGSLTSQEAPNSASHAPRGWAGATAPQPTFPSALDGPRPPPPRQPRGVPATPSTSAFSPAAAVASSSGGGGGSVCAASSSSPGAHAQPRSSFYSGVAGVDGALPRPLVLTPCPSTATALAEMRGLAPSSASWSGAASAGSLLEQLLALELAQYRAAFRSEQRKCQRLERQLRRERSTLALERANLRLAHQPLGWLSSGQATVIDEHAPLLGGALNATATVAQGPWPGSSRAQQGSMAKSGACSLNATATVAQGPWPGSSRAQQGSTTCDGASADKGPRHQRPEEGCSGNCGSCGSLRRRSDETAVRDAGDRDEGGAELEGSGGEAEEEEEGSGVGAALGPAALERVRVALLQEQLAGALAACRHAVAVGCGGDGRGLAAEAPLEQVLLMLEEAAATAQQL